MIEEMVTRRDRFLLVLFSRFVVAVCIVFVCFFLFLAFVFACSLHRVGIKERETRFALNLEISG